MNKKLISLLLAAASVASAWAVPARRGFYPRQTVDGQTVKVECTGDEFGHYFVDTEGRAMLSDADGKLYYAPETEIAAIREHRQARYKARNAARKERMKAAVASRANGQIPSQVGRFPGTSFPSLGKQKAIVILVEYQDVKFKIGDDATAYNYFNDMLNKKGFSENGGTGSVHDYFIDSSNGLFDCDFDVYGPITLKNKMAYYGGNNASGNDLRPGEMVVEACDALNATVNFKDYDRDNDGVIDNVFVIYAGQGESTCEDPNTVWPHSWDMTALGINRTYDGVRLETYGCSNEWLSYRCDGQGGPDGIGTFTHEFSHVLGLPDLYHTEDDYAYYTPGSWSVLDYGPYNNDSNTPPAYSSFERNALGWIELTELTAESGDVTVPELNASNTAYVTSNPRNSKEFFLYESRNLTGWDKYLPAAGMLVWHVDYNTSTWQYNEVNNYRTSQGVDLVEADGRASKEDRDGGDCYPGTSNVTTLTPRWKSDGAVGYTLSNIARNASTGAVSFTVGTSGGNGGGDENVPGDVYTVADVLDSEMDGSAAKVRGYIVGYARGGNWSANSVTFSSDDCDVNTNLVLADSKNPSDYTECIPVKLDKGAERDALNLSDNSSNLGRKVELVCTLDKYFGVPGLRNVSAHTFLAETGINAVTEVTVPADNAVYDLSGRRVANPGRGIYIINGRKVMVR